VAIHTTSLREYSDLNASAGGPNADEPIWGGGMSLFVDRGLLRLEYDQSKANGTVEGIPVDLKLHVLTLQVVWLL
jgi:hypothetical protein